MICPRTELVCIHDCGRDADNFCEPEHMSASQPAPTPQGPAAPTLEQLMADLANVVIMPHNPDDAALAELAAKMAQSIHKDAARYRWLRDHFVFIHCACDDTDAGNFNFDWDDEPAHLDCAIDAAITATPPCK